MLRCDLPPLSEIRSVNAVRVMGGKFDFASSNDRITDRPQNQATDLWYDQ